MTLYNQYCYPPFEQLTEVWQKPYILKCTENSKNQVNFPVLAEFKVFKIILLKKTNAKTLFTCILIKKNFDFAIQHHLPEEPALEMFFSPAWPTQCTHYTVQPWRNDVKLHYFRTSN